MGLSDLPKTPKILTLQKLPKQNPLKLTLFLWSSYIVLKYKNLSKKIWDKMWCYCEQIGEHMGNLRNTLRTSLGTLWEQYMETWWEHQNPQNSQKPNPLPRKKKIEPYRMHVELSRWLHEICLPKTVCCHFQPGPSYECAQMGGFQFSHTHSMNFG